MITSQQCFNGVVVCICVLDHCKVASKNVKFGMVCWVPVTKIHSRAHVIGLQNTDFAKMSF